MVSSTGSDVAIALKRQIDLDYGFGRTEGEPGSLTAKRFVENM